MLPFAELSVGELQERFQWLLANERSRYMIPDYLGDAVLTPSSTSGSRSRSERIVEFRNETLYHLYGVCDRRSIARDVMSNAVFIFDRYLSTFVPGYLRGEADPPPRSDLFGPASLLIAAKALATREDVHRIEFDLGRYSRDVYATGMETKILKALRWEVVYRSPLSIVADLLSLVPKPRGYQVFEPCKMAHEDATFERIKTSLLKRASHLTRLADIHYGFGVQFPPSTIALAALMIALEAQPPLGIPGSFLLIQPVDYFSLAMEWSGVGCCFSSQDVVQCRRGMLDMLKAAPHGTFGPRYRSGSPTSIGDALGSNAVLHSISP